MCALHWCPFFASSRPSLCVCSMKHFHSWRVKFQWIFDAALTAYSELKPLRSFPPTQTLIPWLFGHNYRTRTVGASLVAQLVKNLPAMWEAWVCPLGWEDSLEKRKVPTPVLWPGEFHGLYSPWGPKDSDTTEWLSLSFLHEMFSWYL